MYLEKFEIFLFKSDEHIYLIHFLKCYLVYTSKAVYSNSKHKLINKIITYLIDLLDQNVCEIFTILFVMSTSKQSNVFNLASISAFYHREFLLKLSDRILLDLHTSVTTALELVWIQLTIGHRLSILLRCIPYHILFIS